MTFYKTPESLASEIDNFEKDITNFQNGSLHPVKFKGIRVPFGVYEQREDNTYMLRIRCVAGCITPLQFRKVAQLSEEYGSNTIHITTRQELQIHNLTIDDIIPGIRELVSVGLSSRGGGGNTVRNIIASYNSGINSTEVFDVTPYAITLTNRLIAENDSWLLPRKFKISFSSDPNDNSNATVQDVGFIAAIKDNTKGFSVYVAGGMGAKPDIGHLLYDFVPAEKIYYIVSAIKQLFNKYGNRKNKYQARLRFLWNDLGREKFVRLFQEELSRLESNDDLMIHVIEFKNESIDPEITPIIDKSNEFSIWKKRYVKEQKQEDLFHIKVPLLSGDLSNSDALYLADFLNLFGENVIRFTMDQNIFIRNIPKKYLGNLYDILKNIDSLSESIPLFGNIITCAGADTCKLGLCLPRGVIPEILKALDKNSDELNSIDDIKIHISGCPNSCGQHHVADIGFFGKVGRKNEKSYPAYIVVAGSNLKPGKTKLTERVGEISARDLPQFISDLLKEYNSVKDNFNSYHEYFNKTGKHKIEEICSKYSDVPDFLVDRNYYYDWGSENIFSTAGLGQGECTAGLFDMIDVDINLIKQNKELYHKLDNDKKKNNILYSIVLSAARMLLVTKGLEASSDKDVFVLFANEFIKKGLISSESLVLINLIESLRDQLITKKQEIFSLADEVINLYNRMDSSLRFPSESDDINVGNTAESITVFKDYRGIACPMNFVKAKIDLAKLSSGEKLEILLDDGAPIENVPRSIESEGHKIINQKRIDNHWSVIIEKI